MPIIPQLQRIFSNSDTARNARWAGEHKRPDGKVKDITESLGWKKHVVDSGFFDDIRNIALGLCADGVNPFKKSSHSAWPIVLCVLNYPPDIRSRPDMLILLGIIPGPRTPKNISLYLRLVVDELVAFGEPGFWTWDAFTQEYFELRFMVFRLIGDYPATSKMICMKGSGAIHGCHHCKVVGVKEGRTATWYGVYRSWLSMGHAWRKRSRQLFDTVCTEAAPATRKASDLYALAVCARQAKLQFGVLPDTAHSPNTVIGYCPFWDCVSFDPIDMFFPDFMHVMVCLMICCFIIVVQAGVMKHMWELIKGKRSSAKEGKSEKVCCCVCSCLMMRQGMDGKEAKEVKEGKEGKEVKEGKESKEAKLASVNKPLVSKDSKELIESRCNALLFPVGFGSRPGKLLFNATGSVHCLLCVDKSAHQGLCARTTGCCLRPFWLPS